jgi:intracellular septation protein A
MALTPRGPRHEAGDAAVPSIHRVLRTLGRRSLPHLLEATVLPAVLFWVLLVTIGAGVAMIGVLAWTLLALGRRVVRGAPIPSILLLATVGLSARTAVGVASGSTFAYFIGPIATALALATVFLGSVLVGRPVIGRLAGDFCHLDDEVASRPAVVQLFQGLTLLWAGVHMLTAVTTLAMLLSMSTATYVALKTLVSLAICVTAIVITVTYSVRTARRENLVFATL